MGGSGRKGNSLNLVLEIEGLGGILHPNLEDMADEKTSGTFPSLTLHSRQNMA
jgi:hypothetical protein